MMTVRKKLIEVALPLEAINTASAREKSIRHGHPSTLHLWWARRPLAAARAVIFAQIVDDPSTYVDELKSDPHLKRRGETVLRQRRKAWHEAVEVARKAEGTGLEAPKPGPEPTLDGVLAELERLRLFGIIEQLVLWENTTNEAVIEKARQEIWRSWRRTCAEYADHPRAKELFDRHTLPAFHDPFAGGGALPLEAQRLGLESHASDLNPVAVLINKAMIEIPPRFAGRPPVNPEAREDKNLFAREWKGAQGLAEDVRFYGEWIRHEAETRIGKLYPKVEVTADMAKARPDLNPYVGRKLKVIAWIWARTVKSPNPAFAQVDVPLATSFMLSTKAGKEAYVEPVIEKGGYRFTVKVGKPKDTEGAKNGTKTSGRGANFVCVMSGAPIVGDYIRAEGMAGRIGSRLMAVVAEGDRGRVYLPPVAEHETASHCDPLVEIPLQELPREGGGGRTNFWCVQYGLGRFADLFTPRQLTALTTLSDLIQEARERIQHDARAAGMPDNASPFRSGGTGAIAYGDAVLVYLSFALSKQADLGNSLCRWEPIAQCPRQLFGRQGIPMIWDYAEGNPLGDSSGAWTVVVDGISRAFAKTFEFVPANAIGHATQADAGRQDVSNAKIVSTDPPYYDNIGYADLSDFFYVWLRRSLKPVFPELFGTLAVPKAEELVATPYRHGSKDKAEAFFLDGMTQAMHRLAEQSHPAFPVTIYYAFKQSESDSADGTASTGWETFLDAVIRAGFTTTGTWPMRTENDSRMIGQGTNALASSIVLVCRQRSIDAPTATRREFVSALKAELPVALAHLQRGNIAPVDLAQAAIGPGMAVYTRYAKVLDAEGKPLSVREALALINQTLDETLADQEGDFDADSRFALAWIDQHGFEEGEFGVADVLSRAKVTSVEGLVHAGILESRRGKVRLLSPEELPGDWDPATDDRFTHWESVHHLIRALEADGEAAAASLMAKLGTRAETARELAYRLYNVCERKKRAQDALRYNALVQSWPELVRLAREVPVGVGEQVGLFESE
jgi:putative DNA methylase